MSLECKFVLECGSCTLNLPYEQQVEFKKDLIRDEFREFYSGEFEFFASSPTQVGGQAPVSYLKIVLIAAITLATVEITKQISSIFSFVFIFFPFPTFLTSLLDSIIVEVS